MASPQKENGYTVIANELLEAFILGRFTEYHRKIVLFIWRKTYGFNKKEDWIANSQFVEATGMSKGSVSRAISELRRSNIVIQRDNKLSINKDYSQWLVIQRDNTSYPTGQLLLPPRQPQKKKATITKETCELRSPKNMKKNKMGRYREDRPSDAFDETIDLDSGEYVEEKKRSDWKEVEAVLFLFADPYPLNWKKNTTEHDAVRNLLKEKGREQIEKALAYHREHRSEEWCPRINKPSDLDRKWTNLYQFREKSAPVEITRIN